MKLQFDGAVRFRPFAKGQGSLFFPAT